MLEGNMALTLPTTNPKLSHVQQKLIANRLVFGQKIYDKNVSSGRISGGKSTIIGAGIEELGKGYEVGDAGSDAGALSPNASEYGSLSPRSWYGIDNDGGAHGNNYDGKNIEYNDVKINTGKCNYNSNSNDNDNDNADEEIGDNVPNVDKVVVQLLPLTGHKTTLYSRNLLCKSQDGARNSRDNASSDRPKSAHVTGKGIPENNHLLLQDVSIAFSDRTESDAQRPEPQFKSLVTPLPMLLGPGLQVTSKIGKLALPAKKLNTNNGNKSNSEKLLRPSTSQVELRARVDVSNELKKVVAKRFANTTTCDNIPRLDPPSLVVQPSEILMPVGDIGIKAVQIVKVSRPTKSADHGGININPSKSRLNSPQQRLNSPLLAIMTDSIRDSPPSSAFSKIPLINHTPLPRENSPSGNDNNGKWFDDTSYSGKNAVDETSPRKVGSNYRLQGNESAVSTADEILSWSGGALTDLVKNVVSSTNVTCIDATQKSPLKRRKKNSPGQLHKPSQVTYKAVSPETIKNANIKIEYILNDTYNALNHYDYYEDKNSLLVVPSKLGPKSPSESEIKGGPDEEPLDLCQSMAKILEQINLYTLVKKNKEETSKDAFDIHETLAQDRYLYNQPASYTSQIGPPPAMWESLIKASKLPQKTNIQTNVKIEVFDNASIDSLDDSLFPSSELYQSHADELFNKTLNDLDNSRNKHNHEGVLNDSIASSTVSKLLKTLKVPTDDVPVQLQEQVDSHRIGIISSSNYKFGGGEKNKNLSLGERKNILRERAKVPLSTPALTVTSSHMPYSPRSGKKNADDNHKFNPRPKLSFEIEKLAPEPFR